jgi:hypothetical protein
VKTSVSFFVGVFCGALNLLWGSCHTDSSVLEGALAVLRIRLSHCSRTFAAKSLLMAYTSRNSAKAQRPYVPLLFMPGIQ